MMKVKPVDSQGSDLPAGLASPAQRALASAGIVYLEQLTEISEAHLKQLHGIGPKALQQLRSALHAKGLSFAEDHQKDGKKEIDG